ncbi:MAG: hypothetical protein AB7G23_20935 [Vicinamibacterales bacterium]
MGWFSSKSDDEKKVAAIERNVDDLRDRADGEERAAGWFDRVGAHGAAERKRTNAELDRRLADQEEQCLRSGRYREGHRQHPSIEEQTGKRWW